MAHSHLQADTQQGRESASIAVLLGNKNKRPDHRSRTERSIKKTSEPTTI